MLIFGECNEMFKFVNDDRKCFYICPDSRIFTKNTEIDFLENPDLLVPSNNFTVYIVDSLNELRKLVYQCVDCVILIDDYKDFKASEYAERTFTLALLAQLSSVNEIIINTDIQYFLNK